MYMDYHINIDSNRNPNLFVYVVEKGYSICI